jgi:hypothetical protein
LPQSWCHGTDRHRAAAVGVALVFGSLLEQGGLESAQRKVAGVMSRRTHVYVVCSPRARIGKTLAARVLTEFYRANGLPVLAFDITPEQTLLSYLPRFAVAASLADTRGQMALFDQLIVADERAKVIDLGIGAFDGFFSILKQIGFHEEARRRNIELVILFAVNPDQASAKAYRMLLQNFSDSTVIPVLNEAFVRGFHYRDSFPAQRAVAIPLQVPILSPSLRAIVDTPPFSFTEFRRRITDDVPEHLEGEMHSWLKRTFLQFRELELRLLLEGLQSTLFDDEIHAGMGS